jgi:putative glutamine amidotransferase
MERPGHKWCVLVQWHPEHMFRRDERQRELFEGFVAAAES